MFPCEKSQGAEREQKGSAEVGSQARSRAASPTCQAVLPQVGAITCSLPGFQQLSLSPGTCKSPGTPGSKRSRGFLFDVFPPPPGSPGRLGRAVPDPVVPFGSLRRYEAP